MNCVFGFDVGDKLIGVAIGNQMTVTARGLSVLAVYTKGPDWSTLDKLQRKWQPYTLVVGLPLTLQGGEQAASRRARRFAAQLSQRYQLPVVMIDERHSSQEASRRFAAARKAGIRRRRDASQIDAEAAAMILERWLASASPSSPTLTTPPFPP